MARKNVIPDKEFQEACRVIAENDLVAQYAALHTCDIVEKPWWMPWKNLSTTLNNTIYLAKGWRDWSLAPHLAHEATHLLQQHDMGMSAFLASYAQKPGRLRLELAAHKVELRVYRYLFPNANVPELENDIVRRLATNYAFGDWFDKIMQWRAVQYLRGDDT